MLEALYDKNFERSGNQTVQKWSKWQTVFLFIFLTVKKKIPKIHLPIEPMKTGSDNH